VVTLFVSIALSAFASVLGLRKFASL
jgi:hypothetical protein